MNSVEIHNIGQVGESKMSIVRSVILLSLVALCLPSVSHGRQVLGCHVPEPSWATGGLIPVPTLSWQSFDDCLDAKVTAAEEAAEAALQATIDDLNAAIATLENTVDDVTEERDALREKLERPFVRALTAIEPEGFSACLASPQIDFGAITAAAATDPADHAERMLATMWSDALDLANAKQLASALPGSGSGPALDQVFAQAEATFAEIAIRDPVTACAWGTTEGLRDKAKDAAGQLFPSIRTSYDRMISSQIAPLADAAVAEALAPALEAFTAQARTTLRENIPTEVRRMAMAEATRRVANPRRLTVAADALDDLVRVAQTNPRQVGDALVRFQTRITPLMSWQDETLREVGIDTIRYYGHEVIENQGGALLDYLLAIPDAVKDAGGAASTTGVCATTYEPGCVVSDVISALTQWGIDFGVRPHARGVLMSRAHGEFDKFVDTVDEVQRTGRMPMDPGRLHSHLSGLPGAIQLSNIAIPELAELRAAHEHYHSTVMKLAQLTVELSTAR